MRVVAPAATNSCMESRIGYLLPVGYALEKGLAKLRHPQRKVRSQWRRTSATSLGFVVPSATNRVPKRVHSGFGLAPAAGSRVEGSFRAQARLGHQRLLLGLGLKRWYDSNFVVVGDAEEN